MTSAKRRKKAEAAVLLLAKHKNQVALLLVQLRSLAVLQESNKLTHKLIKKAGFSAGFFYEFQNEFKQGKSACKRLGIFLEFSCV